VGSQSRYKTVKARAKEDQFVVDYLLGLSSEIEQNQIETRYFRDQSFYEEVLLHEDELICDYLSNDLPRRERQRFEQHFLQSPHRRQKLQSTRRLMAYLADQGTESQYLPLNDSSKPLVLKAASPRGWLNHLAGLLVPKLSIGRMLATTALLLMCGFWLTAYIKDLRQNLRKAENERLTLQRQEQDLLGTTRRQQAEAAAKRDEAASLSELVASGANSLSASLERPSPTPVTIKLTLATARSGAAPTEIKLPRNSPIMAVALQLEAQTPESSRRYIIKMRSTEVNSATWQWEANAQNGQVLLEIPTAGISPGMYSLTLTHITNPSQANEFAGEIFLRLSLP
jgi:hypothetical protein